MLNSSGQNTDGNKSEEKAQDYIEDMYLELKIKGIVEKLFEKFTLNFEDKVKDIVFREVSKPTIDSEFTNRSEVGKN